MAEIVDEIINITLEKLSVQPELVEPKSWDQLRKIENVISEAFSIQENVKNEIKKNKPSINNIATKAQIARQTIYNNELLKKYIEIRISSYNELDPAKKNEKLLERIADLEGQIKDMIERDVNIELMRRKITLLEKELKESKKANKELLEKYNNLQHKDKNYKNDQNHSSSKVTVMPNLR